MIPWKQRFELSFDPDSVPASGRRRLFADAAPIGKARMLALAHLMKAGRGWADEAPDAFFWRLFNAAVADALFLFAGDGPDALMRVLALAGVQNESVDVGALGPFELIGLARGAGAGPERLRLALALHPKAPPFSETGPDPDVERPAQAFLDAAFQAGFEFAKALAASRIWAERASEAERVLGPCFDPVEIYLDQGPGLAEAIVSALECEALAAVSAAASEARPSAL